VNLLLSIFAVIISIVGATVLWLAFLNDNLNWWNFCIWFACIVIPGIINDMYEDTLRKNYEDENNIKFDGVIQTRNDIFISYELLVRCIKTIKVENYFLKNSIFTPGGVSLHPYSDIGVCLILQTDTFYFGISSIMDKLIDMYDYLNTDATELQTHFIQPEFFNRKNIHCYSIKTHPLVIRDTDVRKNGRPTSKSLIKIKNEKGIDWIFQTELQEVSKEYWNYK